MRDIIHKSKEVPRITTLWNLIRNINCRPKKGRYKVNEWTIPFKKRSEIQRNFQFDGGGEGLVVGGQQSALSNYLILTGLTGWRALRLSNSILTILVNGLVGNK